MSSDNKNWIICSGPDWFRPSVTSTRQIIYQFREKGYRVLWVNPIAFKSPAVNSDSKKSMRRKIVNKLKTHLRIFHRAGNGIFVFVPFYIPAFSQKWDRINGRLMRLQMAIISALFGISYKNTILWISGSFTLSPLLGKGFKTRVYQAADLISEFRTSNAALLADLRAKETHLSTSVQHLFASSPNIQQKLSVLSGRTVHLLTHGVDFTHFTTLHTAHPDIQQIKLAGKPVAGYFGTLSDANDKDVFLALAQNGFSVVLIGKVLGDYGRLEHHPDIHFIGPVGFSELPSYAQYFDICLLNWIMADWIRNSFPVKTLEYLAMGKPVISCKIPVVEQMFGDLIYFAETPAQFVEMAHKALSDDSKSRINMRIDAASEHTWKSKFEKISAILGLSD